MIFVYQEERRRQLEVKLIVEEQLRLRSEQEEEERRKRTEEEQREMEERRKEAAQGIKRFNERVQITEGHQRLFVLEGANVGKTLVSLSLPFCRIFTRWRQNFRKNS